MPSPENLGSSALPAGRYGPEPRRVHRTVLITVGVVAAALAVAYVVWVALFHANQPVRAGLESYRVMSDRSVEVVIRVVKDSDVAAVCLVRARSRDGVEVGRQEIEIPRGPEDEVRSITLTTTGRAITGELLGCEPIDESRTP